MTERDKLKEIVEELCLIPNLIIEQAINALEKIKNMRPIPDGICPPELSRLIAALKWVRDND